MKLSIDKNGTAPELLAVELEDDEDVLFVGRSEPDLGPVGIFRNGDVYVWPTRGNDEPRKVFAGVRPLDIAETIDTASRRRIGLRTAGQLRRLLEQLPDDTPIAMRVAGMVGNDVDVFSDEVHYARIVDAAEHLPYQFRLTLAGEGAL